MKELPKKILTPKQWERLASRIIMVKDASQYALQMHAAASSSAANLATRKLTVIPEGIPLPVPYVETDFTMEAHWIWIGAVNPERKGRRIIRDYNMARQVVTVYQQPYSVVNIDGKRTSAHRALYEHFVETFEEFRRKGSRRRWTPGKLVQDCGVPLCVNPRHWHHQVAVHKQKDWNPHEHVYAVEAETDTLPVAAPTSTPDTPQEIVDQQLEALLASPVPPSSWEDVIGHIYFDRYSGIPQSQTIQAIRNARKLHLLPPGEK